jgi:metallophosphoesterase superfamily enzyme
VLADVHLGYSAARQRHGDAIPSRTVADELKPLVEAAREHELRAVVVAGDLFENGFDVELYRQFLDVLDPLHIAFVGLVPGNHDRGADKTALAAPLFPNGYDLAGWRVAHGDRPLAESHAIAGHWHPATRWKRRKLPCFLTRGTQVILPAFSLDAAGVQVDRDPRWRDWHRWAIDGGKVVAVK